MTTWNKTTDPEPIEIGPIGWLLVIVRGVPLAVLVFGGLVLSLFLRLIERPLFGLHRPVTPYLTQFVCRNALRIMGLGFVTRGKMMTSPGAVVSNHVSWLDIFALNARKRIYFVSKAEVAGWPGIGWLAQATGTVFIERNRSKALDQTKLFETRLRAGHKLLFFPEGTSTDGLRLLPFKTSLFEPFFSEHLRDRMQIQPISVIYRAPKGEPARFYGWWGDMGFAPHLLKTLATPRQGSVQVIYHAPLKVASFSNRKELALACERAVRAGLEENPTIQPDAK